MTTIIEALHAMYDAGIRQIDIYYAELINDKETEFSVDVMCDPINNLTMHSWTWTITSSLELEKMLEDDDYFVCVDWEIITDSKFSEDVVCEAVHRWILDNGLDICVQVIDIDDAVGSGYVRELRNMDMDFEIENSVPLIAL